MRLLPRFHKQSVCMELKNRINTEPCMGVPRRSPPGPIPSKPSRARVSPPLPSSPFPSPPSPPPDPTPPYPIPPSALCSMLKDEHISCDLSWKQHPKAPRGYPNQDAVERLWPQEGTNHIWYRGMHSKKLQLNHWSRSLVIIAI